MTVGLGQGQCRGGDLAEAAPLEAFTAREDLRHHRLGAVIAPGRDGAPILVLDVRAALVDLAHQHQDRLQNVQRFEAGDHHRLAMRVCTETVGVRADDHADVRGSDEPVDGHGFGGADVEDRPHRGRREHVVAEHGEVLQPLAFCSEHGEGRGRRRGLEADGEEHHLPCRVRSRQGEGVAHGVDHAHVGTSGAGLEQALAAAAGHAQHVAVGTQDDLGVFRREAQGHVEAADRQHAHGAARAVDQVDVGRQQVGYAVAEDGMRVTPAELHEAVAAAGADLGGDGLGQAAGALAVAELVNVFHRGPPPAFPLHS